MTDYALPVQVLYAGLGGTVLALIVATAQQKWQAKVFFLLALRLAIGWHFLFEGLYKVNSHRVGLTDTNRPFTSKPYFDVAPTGVGAYMRGQFGDPAAVIAAKVLPPTAVPAAAFDKLSTEEQAAACPPAVAGRLDELEAKAEGLVQAEAAADVTAATAAEQTGLADAKTDADRAKVTADADKARAAARKKSDSSKQAARELLTAAKAQYARWVYGVDGRPARVKFVTGEVTMTGPQRLEHLDWLRQEVEAADGRRAAGLGNGFGTESRRAAGVRADLVAAEADLAKDADDFVAELADTLGDKPADGPPPLTPGQRMDQLTMWFLVAVGGCLMLGLLTRVACVAAAGFLVVTYLTHPPFPWYPLPPNTEGNPVFVNKNAIEALALLALACMPTGQWLGLDALVMRAGWRFKLEPLPPGGLGS